MIISIFIVTGCSKLSSLWDFGPNLKNVKMPKILFVHSVHFDYKDYHVLSYIDEGGNIYTITPYEPERLVDMHETLELQDDQITGQVDKEKLLEMYRLFLQVPSKDGKSVHTIYSEHSLAVEMEKNSWYGMRYNPAGEIEAIHLKTNSNSSYYNGDEKAQKISDWLMDVLPIKRYPGD